MRSVSRALARQLRDEPPQLVVALSLELLRMGYRLIAHELIARHKATLQSLDIESVEMLAGDLDSWHTVDVFCICVAGPCWREGRFLTRTLPVGQGMRARGGEDQRSLQQLR